MDTLLHRSPARHAASVGAWCGAALGAFEIGLLAAAHGDWLNATAESVLVVLAPIVIYALGGALLGALVRRPSIVRALAGAGVLLLVHLRFGGFGYHVWPLAAGAAAAACCALASWRLASPRLFVGSAPVAVPLAAALVAFAALADDAADPRATRHTSATSAPAGSPNVVLVTWDTVRGDSWPALGGKGLDTPALDALVREGLLLENLHAVTPVTAPSHLSILSGLYPTAHGLRSNGDAAPPSSTPRLSEILAARGYDTGAFVSNYSLQGRFGFDRGFAAFADRPSPHPLARTLALAWQGCVLLKRTLPASVSAAAYQTAGAVTLERALDWYEDARAPAFLWVHFYDAHFPYEPKEPFLSRALARADEGPPAADPRSQRLRALQRGEIEELDELLARLRVALEAKDPGLANTLVALVADHGECFGEGGFLHEHHASLYDATQRIGGVVRLPSSDARAPRGVRSAAPTSQIDFLPSLGEYLGLELPPGLPGSSFLRGDAAPASAARGLYMETFQRELGAERMHGWWEDGFKYVRTVAGVERLLRAENGGAETDVARAHPERVATLRARLDAFLATQSAAVPIERALSVEDRSALQALGYAGD